MKLTGTNSSILQAAKQPTRLEESSSLIFIYPMIVDKLLDRKWTNILRDFFTSQFTAQIKISNVLNITSQATKHSINNSNLDKIENAAEFAATGTQDNTLNLLTNKQIPVQDSSQYYINNMTKYEYQDKVNQFRSFIKSQIEIDPRFNDTRPLISNITVENLIDIPMVIGTKSFTVDSLSLFWILFFATGQYREDFDKTDIPNPIPDTTNDVSAIKTLRLDKTESFEYIKRFIKTYMNNRDNFRNYEHVLGKLLEIPAKSVPSNRITSLMHSVDSDIDRAIRTFQNATNESRYSDEIGFSRNAAISIQNAYNDSRALERSVQLKAQTLFSSFIANYIVPTAQKLSTTLVTVDEVNIVRELSKLSNDLLDNFMGTYTLLASTIQSELVNQASEAGINQLDSFQGMCEANSRLSIVPILTKFKNLQFSLTSNRDTLINFIEQVNEIASQLSTYRQGIENNLVALTNTTVRARLKEITNLGNSVAESRHNPVFNILYGFFRDQLQSEPNQPNNQGPPRPVFDRLRLFFGQSVDVELYLQQVCTALTAISTFMAYYVFFSYLCEFIGEIKAKVDIQKKDALDFPNYCLVIRREVVEALYMALAVKNYNDQKDIADYKTKETRKENRLAPTKFVEDTVPKAYRFLKSKLPGQKLETVTEPPPPIANFTNFKVTETEITNMIRTLNTRLNVPNLIVVDDKTDTIYYKWMYSGTMVHRLNMSTLNNYIKHQQEALPGY